MKAPNTIGRATTRDGEELALYERDGVFQIRIDGMELMSSRAHGSEKALAELTREAIRRIAAPKVLIGGLGMGYTLRSALECFPQAARLVVAEVFPQVVAWNRGPLAHLAGRPLDDPRVELRQKDVSKVIASEPFDAIVLDVDNGPAAFTLESNGGLYTASGLARIRRGLTPRGVLSVWSAADEPAFERRMRRAGFKVSRERIPARGRGGGPRHTIYLGQ
ncbi:MAG: hypothetical protein AAF657_38270 [Acidobacteriota bacterium]